MAEQNPRQSKVATTFSDQAKGRQGNLAGELLAFLRNTRKWWLAPVIVLLALVGVLVVLGGTSVAPFIYTLF